MKISVVTVSLNSEPTIGYTIESFLAQSYADKEMLVIDGRSTDRTLDVVRSFCSDQVRIWSEPDHGTYDAMNKGLQRYTGDSVGFLNSNDSFHDSKVLETIVERLQVAEAVYGDIRFIRDHATKRVVRTWKAGPYRHGSFRSGWLPPHPTFYIRRELASRVGFFDTAYGSTADYDFMLRALELQNPAVCYIPRILVDFMQGGISSGSLTGYMRANLLCLKSRRRHLDAPPIDFAFIAKPLRKLHQFHWPG